MSSRISLSPTYENPSAMHHLIFFITGNPGLISYYDTFLGTLHLLLSNQYSSKSDVFHIYGESLAGFGDNDSPSKTTGYPYTLEDQIETRLQCLKDQKILSGPRQGGFYDSVILMGHSVGTYILLEVLQRLRKSSSTLKVKAGILLMPTVIGLAESSSGVRAKPLFQIPGFPRGASLIANALLTPIPKSGVKWLVKLMLGMPDAGAEVTARFLKSSMGIWQALHLARDELETITEDKWDEDIWGIEHKDVASQKEIPKLIFYFAEEDHWVANHTRDWLISARGKEEGDSWSSKPEMSIDINGVGHDFCIRHSEIVAEKVKLWIDDIIEASR